MKTLAAIFKERCHFSFDEMLCSTDKAKEQLQPVAHIYFRDLNLEQIVGASQQETIDSMIQPLKYRLWIDSGKLNETIELGFGHCKIPRKFWNFTNYRGIWRPQKWILSHILRPTLASSSHSLKWLYFNKNGISGPPPDQGPWSLNFISFGVDLNTAPCILI